MLCKTKLRPWAEHDGWYICEEGTIAHKDWDTQAIISYFNDLKNMIKHEVVYGK